MHPEDIKAAIRKKGVTLAGLARQLGVQPSALSQSLYRPVSAQLERKIASFIGRRPSAVWPNRFDAAGRRIRASNAPTSVTELAA